MAFVHAKGKEKNETYQQLSHRYFRMIMGNLRVIKNVSNVHWVRDHYDQPMSPKHTERLRRGQIVESPVAHQVAANIPVPRWEEIMGKGTSKAAFLNFISEEWTTDVLLHQLPLGLSLYSGGTFTDRHRSVCVSSEGTTGIPDLESDQEEAET